PDPQGIVADPGAAAIGVATLGREQRCARPGMVVVEVAPDVLDEPTQRPSRPVDQRHDPFPRSGTPFAFAVADVDLAEPAQIPFDVMQIQLTGLVHPEPDLG